MVAFDDAGGWAQVIILGWVAFSEVGGCAASGAIAGSYLVGGQVIKWHSVWCPHPVFAAAACCCPSCSICR